MDHVDRLKVCLFRDVDVGHIFMATLDEESRFYIRGVARGEDGDEQFFAVQLPTQPNEIPVLLAGSLFETANCLVDLNWIIQVSHRSEYGFDSRQVQIAPGHIQIEQECAWLIIMDDKKLCSISLDDGVLGPAETGGFYITRWWVRGGPDGKVKLVRYRVRSSDLSDEDN